MSIVSKTVTPAQVAANRSNSEKSTGPRTARGKDVVRYNALKHWGRAETLRDLMPALGEDPAEYQAVVKGLWQSLAPEDYFEDLLVKDLADLHWRLRRAIQAETAQQAKLRRLEVKRQDELEAEQENGGLLSAPERELLALVGFTGLPDSPSKFYRIIQILKAFAMLVGHGQVAGEGVAHLKTLYGPYPSAAGHHLISSYQEYLGASESSGEAAGEARRVASRQAFLKALEAEIAWFEERAVAERQATAELAAARVESEMLYCQPDPDRVMLYQERLERRFERKWKMLMRYRRWRRAEAFDPWGGATSAPAGVAGGEGVGEARGGKIRVGEGAKGHEQSHQVIENTGKAMVKPHPATENQPWAQPCGKVIGNQRHQIRPLPRGWLRRRG